MTDSKEAEPLANEERRSWLHHHQRVQPDINNTTTWAQDQYVISVCYTKTL